MKKSFFLSAFIALFSLLVISCSNDDSKTSRVVVKLVDAPGDFEEVLIDVQDVMIKRNNDWESLGSVTPQVYDLLKLTGGVEALLTDSEIPSGKISQIRLVLGDNNSVVKNGETIALDTPSAQQSGLKLNVHQDLVPGVTYTFILDFIVDKSIVEKGNNKFSLKPTIRVNTEALSGAISGIVTPFEKQVEVKAMSETDTISTYTNTEGKFLLHGVPKGTYNVLFTPDTTTELSSKTIEKINVTTGENKDLGTIKLQ